MASFCPAVAERIGGDRALMKQLEELAQGHGVCLVHDQRAWASITFQGTRHKLTWAFDGECAVEAGEAMAAELPEHEFNIPGRLVADATVASSSHRLMPPRLELQLELLVLEDH